MPASYLARIGVTVFALLFATALATEREAAAIVATASTIDAPVATVPTAGTVEGPFAIPAVFVIDGPVAVAGFQAMPSPEGPVLAAAVAEAPAVEAIVVAPVLVPAPVIVAPQVPAPVAAVSQDGIVLASWYGPGFYGNRTACGQIYTPEILGVAHKTLPCGTLLTLTYGSRVLTVPVIDRGPYVAGRTLDLSNATKLAIGCSDLCTLRMQVLR